MLGELLKFNKLGNKEELQFILFNALPVSDGQSIEGLRQYSLASIFTIGNSFNGMLKLLECISFIDIQNDKVFLNNKVFDLLRCLPAPGYFNQPDFVSSILIFLKRENSISSFFIADAIKYFEKRNIFYLKENLIPYKYFTIRNLFISIGFLERDKSNSNHLLVNPLFNECFKNIVINELQINPESNFKKRLTYEQLQKRLALNEKYGADAEIFVEFFEKKRLNGHLLENNIKRISKEFVNAGYDIESFDNRESIFIDRYIEVKSFTGDVSFYWSKGEVNAAKNYGDKYYLYLVDRSKINEEDYTPSIFQNPYQKVFENQYWKKEIEKWKITLE